MKKKVLAFITSIATLLIMIPAFGVSGEADPSAAKETITLHGFDKWTTEEIALCEQKQTASVTINTDAAHIPTGATSSLCVTNAKQNYFRLGSMSKVTDPDTSVSKNVFVDVFPDGLTGFDGIAFWTENASACTTYRIDVGHQPENADDKLYFTYKVNGGMPVAKNFKGYLIVPFAKMINADGYSVAFDASKINFIAVQPYNGTSGDTGSIYLADLRAFRATDTIVTDKLQSAIEKAKTLKAEDYTSDSWSAFQTVVGQAETLKATPTTQLAVNQMTTNLTGTAVKALVAAANKTTLKAKIDEIDAMSQGKYSNETWAALLAKNMEAKALYADTSAIQAKVDAMVNDLATAKGALVELTTPDVTALNAALAEIEPLNKDRYTTESWTTLANAVTAAKTELASDSKTQQSVNEKLAALQTAKENLTLANVDKTALQALITEVEAIEQGNKTAESWTALTEALAAAKKTATDSEATQKDVDAAKETLLAAKSALKDKPADKSVLKQYVEAGRKLTAADYVETTWPDFDTALTAGEAALANEKATQDEINNAQSGVINAWNKLKKYSYLYISSFDFANMNQFDAQQVSKENISLLNSGLPSGFTKGIKFSYDATGKGWASISPYGENVEDYPSLAGYDTIQYYIKLDNVKEFYDAYVSLGISITGEAFNLYTCKKEINAGSSDWQLVSFPVSEFARNMGTGGFDLERYNIIILGVHSYSTGSVSFTGMRAVKTVAVQAPAFTSTSEPTTPVKTGEGATGLAAACLLFVVAAAYIVTSSRAAKHA